MVYDFGRKMDSSLAKSQPKFGKIEVNIDTKDRLLLPPLSPGCSRQRHHSNYSNKAVNPQQGYPRHDQSSSGGSQQQNACIQPIQAGSYDFRRNNGAPHNFNEPCKSNRCWFNRGCVNFFLFSLYPSHVSPDFIGGRIKHYWKVWGLISADLWILGVVSESFRLKFESPPVVWVVTRNVGMSEVKIAIG